MSRGRPSCSHHEPAPDGLWELSRTSAGLISSGLYVAAALFLFAWVSFAAVAVGRRLRTR